MRGKIKLHLGSGSRYLEGWTNVEINREIKADVYHDLNKFPWPFKTSSVSEVRMFHLWEHLDYVYEILDELHRVCKNDAIIHMRVPHATRNLTEPVRPMPFSYAKIIFLLNENKYKNKFKLILIKFNDGYQTATPIGRTIGRIKSGIFNVAPMFFERNFIYLVNGLEEIEFKLAIKK